MEKLKIVKKALFLLFLIWGSHSFAQISSNNVVFNNKNLQIELPDIIVKNVIHKVKIQINDDSLQQLYHKKQLEIQHKDSIYNVLMTDGQGVLSIRFSHRGKYSFSSGQFNFTKQVNPIPLWLSILPPLIAIIMALVFKEVYSALFTGLLFGTATISYYQGANIFVAFFQGIFRVVDTYVIQSLLDSSHLSIIIFSMIIGATVSLITANGGMRGVVNKLTRYADNRYSGQFITWLLGIFIFFDDYANTLVVGNTMRPITDRLKISREKLAYIVDSTAAPIASIAFVTTWIGAELGYIEDGMNTIGITESAYSIFIRSLQYSFYPIFTLFFILFLIIRKKDFGPMLKAERQSANSELSKGFIEVLNEKKFYKGHKARWFNAAIPILVIILGAIAGLLYTGWDTEIWNSNSSLTTKISAIIGASNSSKALLWSSISGMIVAVILTVSQSLISLRQSMESLVEGFKVMLPAILILTLAWALALLTEHLHSATFITNILTAIQIKPFLVPALTFIIAALVSFSTGSSWGTMAILYPLILPASWIISQQAGFEYDASMAVFLNVVSSVLAGSVLGDHCSPISDTTILSSLASSCNHIEHVRTQLPYALVVGIVSLLVGTIPAALGVSSAILFPLGLFLLLIIVILFGKRVD